MHRKIRIGLLFGGRSAEHEVSLMTARNVYDALDKEKYEIVLVGIDKDGKWYLNDASHFLLNSKNPSLIALNKTATNVVLTPYNTETQLVSVTDENSKSLDVVFPLLHGPYGEDGTVQGLLKLANIPFVGTSVLGSAVGMDKDVMKRLLKEAGIPIGKFLVVNHSEKITFQVVTQQLGMPVFVKPANMGSSVGVSKVHDESEFVNAVSEAFQYDSKIIIEEAIVGREIECSVLGNEEPLASVAGEIIPTHEFYDYEAKYIDENGAQLVVPADLSADILHEVQTLAVKVFKTLCCEGMARVDMFLTKEGKMYVNEINTIPGFTNISMYPKLWEASGIPYSKLIDRLIDLAFDRHQRDAALQSTRH